MLPVLPDLLPNLPSCLFLWQQCLNTVKFCFRHFSCPVPPQYPFLSVSLPPVTAPVHCGCSCWGSSVLTGAPLPTPLPSILITNVHNFVFVISMCCLRPNYTICTGLSNAAHLLCEKQFRNPSLTSAGVFLLWSEKIRVMVWSAQHEIFCLCSGCQVSAAVQDGLQLCKHGWSASCPTVQPWDSNNPQLRLRSKMYHS